MYQALYRKYRPKDFDSVVGQDSIIKTLKNSIINHNFSHAYMFFGPRGTGKTTISKIFARNINCLNPKDGIACGECIHCKASFSKDCIDIIEIDAASNNGVDEIRDLKNKITLVPSELQYKVYIIDEVHMLSIGAFNALLKTLEEPPEHAIFILATTDPQKVPETIISRCQCFSFQRLSTKVIKDRLDFVCKEEKIKIDDDVLLNISLISDGGMRDALGLLDKLTSYTTKKITMEDFIEVNGIISNDQINQFIENVLLGNISTVLQFMEDFDNNGKNLIQILIQILNCSRNLLVDYYLNDTKYGYSVELLQEFANCLNEKMFDIKKSSNTRIFMEMFLLKFINDFVLKKNVPSIIEEKTVPSEDTNFVENTTKNVVVEKSKSSNSIESIQNSSETEEEDEDYDFSKEFGDDENDSFSDTPMDFVKSASDTSSTESISPKILNIGEIMSVRVNNTLALANKSLLKEEIQNFELLKDYTFDQEIGYIVCSLLDSTIRVVSNQHIVISFEYDSNVKQNLLLLDKMVDVYHKITNSDKDFAIITDEEWEKVKNEYIVNLKNNKRYEVIEEPEAVLEELEKNDIITNSAVELFGDIVEIE